MPERDREQRFRRGVVEGSRLQYVRQMKYFYESQLNELSKLVGKETEHRVVVTDEMLQRIEERLSEFEKKEKEIIDNYRKFARQIEGVAI